MLYELDVLEARQIADLALDARKVRDQLLVKVSEDDLRERAPARDEPRNDNTILNGLLETAPAFIALRQAIAALPRDIREKLWVVARTGRGDATIRDWEEALGSASRLRDDDIIADLIQEPDLHHHLRKGLYELHATNLPGDEP